jgi:hypothetical protein
MAEQKKKKKKSLSLDLKEDEEIKWSKEVASRHTTKQQTTL